MTVKKERNIQGSAECSLNMTKKGNKAMEKHLDAQ